MHRHTRSEAGDVPSPRSSRAPSFSSDRPSVAGSITFQMPSSARPAPAYIAASVASQIVTDHHNAQLRHEGGPHADGAPDLLTNAVFSEQALNLLNGFLDNLLFAFLSTARSPSLTAIRGAITDVLKPRLAREATATADDELQGLLGGEDEEEEFPEHLGNGTRKWDLEKVWKRTRLRIMVYTRLGELEDEDEQRYVEQERGLSMDDSDDEADLVSWASAIFLTSVIEYVAEQCLLVSGQASYTRMSAKLRKAAQLSEDGELHQLERITVEDFDVEKIALNAALGRLWRTWRKRVRSPAVPLSPSGPRSKTSHSSLHSRSFSYDTIDNHTMPTESVPEMPEHQPTETEIAANIPLPIGDNDVNEIEVPGLARVLDEEDSTGTQTPTTRPQRPTSVILLSSAENIRRLARERPLSLPPPAAQPLNVPTQTEAEADDLAAHDEEVEELDEVFATPMERGEASDDDSYIHDEQQESMHHEHDEGDAESDADMVAFAASTGMGFGMSPASPTRSGGFDKEDEDAMSTPTKSGYAEPRVMQSKRLSIEKPGPPGVVRTASLRSSQRGSPAPTPEAKTFKDNVHRDVDDSYDPEAIGVARTSNVPIPATPSPPVEKVSAGPSSAGAKRKQPDHQGFVELAPRQVVTTVTSAPAVRKSPSPENRSAAQSSRTQPKVEQRKESPREVTSAPRPPVTPSRSRGPTLASLQEADSAPSSPQGDETPRQQTFEPQRAPHMNNSPKNYGTIRARDAPVPSPVGERPVRRPTLDGSPVARAGTGDSFGVDKPTLKRVSSSSTSRSASTSILNTGRDSEASTRPRGLSGRMSEEDRQREFDTLVKSEDTVKYTLTPQNVRDMDNPPVLVRKTDPPSRPTTASVTVYPRVSADKDNQFGSQSLPPRNNSRSSAHATANRVANSSSSVGRKPLAREPRIQSESMRDFADFIRSTGPAAGEERPVQPFVALTNRATPSPGGSSTALSGLVRKVSTRQLSSHSKSNSVSENGPSARPRIHMEPRGPAGERTGNEDLIDFIRQGPPGQSDGQHRIPRSVAPFRSTVDSDQFDRMLDEHGNIESAYGSQISTTSRHSANSKTGLIGNASTVQPAYSNTPQKLTGNLSSPEPQVQRTRRRIKDPYAIDLSDDEDDDLLTALPKSNKREESLMDFLNSADPPPSNDPQPLLLSGAALAAAKARAAGNSNGASAGRNGVTSPNGANEPRVNKPRLQAREPAAGLARSATDDLADFLRTSGPPEPVNGNGHGRGEGGEKLRKEQKEGVGKKGRFWRRRGVEES